MAVPTITSVTPAVGHSGGEVAVEVQGTNFRLPPDPPATGPVPVPEFGTVEVLFGTVPARNVSVLTDSLLVARAPAHDPGSVALTVRNLDDSGVLIPGEEVVEADAFEFARPDLAIPGAISCVTRALIAELRRQVLEETVHTWHTDWTDSPDDTVRVTHIAKLPAVLLAGPRTPANLFFRRVGLRREQLSVDRVDVYRPRRTVDLVFVVGGVTNHASQMLVLLEAIQDFFHRNPRLEVRRDPNDPGAGTVRYEMAFDPGEDFGTGMEGNRSNTKDFAGTIVIRGVDIELQGFELDMSIDRERELTEDPIVGEPEPI